MGRFLDQRSSMNAGTNINVELTTPTLFGIVGLETQGVAGPIVDLNGTIGLQTSGTNSLVRINIVRGTTLTDPVIYSSTVTLEAAGTKYVPFMAQDLAAPAALQTVYSAIVSRVAAGGGTVSRIGTETFWGLASQG